MFLLDSGGYAIYLVTWYQNFPQVINNFHKYVSECITLHCDNAPQFSHFPIGRHVLYSQLHPVNTLAVITYLQSRGCRFSKSYRAVVEESDNQIHGGCQDRC